MSFPGGAVAKNPPAKAGDTADVSSTTGSGRSPGEGNGNLLQCSSLEKFHGRGSLGGYSPWDCRRVGYDWVTERTQMEETAARWNADTATTQEELSEGTFTDTNGKCSSRKKLSQSDASKETLRHMSWLMAQRIKRWKMTQTFKGEWQFTTQHRWLFHIVSYMTEKKTSTSQTTIDNFLKKWNTSILNASKMAQMVKNLPTMQETWVQSLGRELAEEMATHSSIHAQRIHGQRSLAGYSPWDHKESDMTEWLTCTQTDINFIFFSFLYTVKTSGKGQFSQSIL